jgi:SAM-dependent methyltransferase
MASPKGRLHAAQHGSPGIANVLQQAVHNPVCAPIAAPHSGQRGGKIRSISGSSTCPMEERGDIGAMLSQPLRAPQAVARISSARQGWRMASKAPPHIFSPARRIAARRRMLALQARPDPARYLIDDMVEDVLERLAFLRFEPTSALVIGDYSGALARELAARGVAVAEAEPGLGFGEEQPFPFDGFDLIASLGTLDTVNDLPGALLHIRKALNPGGMMIASFVSAGSLPVLREVMLAADGDRPAPRVHPSVDARSGAQLLQRTLFADPVTDHRPVDVGFRSLERLVGDVRAQGLSNVLADPGPSLGKAALSRARDAFAAAGTEGRTVERFEILTLSGWKR